MAASTSGSSCRLGLTSWPCAAGRRSTAFYARLWLLALPCAAAGSSVVWRTDDVVLGVVAFLVALAVLGPFLWVYERRRKR